MEPVKCNIGSTNYLHKAVRKAKIQYNKHKIQILAYKLKHCRNTQVHLS